MQLFLITKFRNKSRTLTVGALGIFSCLFLFIFVSIFIFQAGSEHTMNLTRGSFKTLYDQTAPTWSREIEAQQQRISALKENAENGLDALATKLSNLQARIMRLDALGSRLAKFVDFDDFESIKNAIDKDTQAIFCEAIANPGGYITDLDEVASISDKAGIPLIVDNTSATPYLCRPIDHGATIIVHSTTKYLTGNGTVTGGCVVDSGKFDWTKSGKFPSLSEPEPAYHGLKFAETFGEMAFTFHGIAIGLRDLGMTMNPQAAHYSLLGIETLSLRMDKHIENAMKVTNWLESHPAVDKVTYAGLESSPYFKRVEKICPKGAGGLFTISLKGGYDSCVKFVDNLDIFSHVANLGDSRSLVIHPASTTHRQLTTEQQRAAGTGPEIVRISIGIEDSDDLISDLKQALDKSVK